MDFVLKLDHWRLRRLLYGTGDSGTASARESLNSLLMTRAEMHALVDDFKDHGIASCHMRSLADRAGSSPVPCW
jgi:hypothetical protein